MDPSNLNTHQPMTSRCKVCVTLGWCQCGVSLSHSHQFHLSRPRCKLHFPMIRCFTTKQVITNQYWSIKQITLQHHCPEATSRAHFTTTAHLRHSYKMNDHLSSKCAFTVWKKCFWDQPADVTKSESSALWTVSRSYSCRADFPLTAVMQWSKYKCDIKYWIIIHDFLLRFNNILSLCSWILQFVCLTR